MGNICATVSKGDDAVNVFSVDEGNETVMNMTSLVDI